MTQITKALTWAAIILITAFVLKEQGVSSSASAGVVFGLAGAAWATIGSDAACGKRCLL